MIVFPGQEEETWRVCRAHDRDLKLQAVRSLPRKPSQVDDTTPNVVRCGGCRRVLEERSDVAVDRRRPCPVCGSTVRNIEVHLADSLSLHESLRARTKTPGKGGWMLDTQSGDAYTRDLGAWGKRALTRDREHDLYREVIELWDGTRSRARPGCAITGISHVPARCPVNPALSSRRRLGSAHRGDESLPQTADGERSHERRPPPVPEWRGAM